MSEKKGLFSRLRDGLFKSRENMAVAMDAAMADNRPIDEDFYDDLMDALILSDMGAQCAQEAVDKLRAQVKEQKLRFPMPMALCSYCLGETKIGAEYQIGNLRKADWGDEA